MSHEILHIKDAYYFDVPKFMWRYHNLDDVPSWIRENHPQATLADFQEHLDGKILIPQPFGPPKNLYEASPGHVQYFEVHDSRGRGCDHPDRVFLPGSPS